MSLMPEVEAVDVAPRLPLLLFCVSVWVVPLLP